MKALSIKQPWAWLQLALVDGEGIKPVENRGWSVPKTFTLPQRIYVQASLSKSDMTKEVVASILRHLNNRQAAAFMLAYEHLTFGAIIGEETITACKFRFGEENGNLYSSWHIAGQYGFIRENPVLYDKPIPYRGQLGFFEVKL